MPRPTSGNPLEFNEIAQILRYLMERNYHTEVRVRFQERTIDGYDSEDDVETRFICHGGADWQEAADFVERSFRRQEYGEGRVASVRWKNRDTHDRLKIYSNFDVTMRTRSLADLQEVARLAAAQQRLNAFSATLTRPNPNEVNIVRNPNAMNDGRLVD